MMKFLLVRDIGPLANPGELNAASRIPRPKVPSCETRLPLSGNGNIIAPVVYVPGLNAFEVKSPSNLCQGCFSFCSTSVTILRIFSSTGGVASS